MSERIDRRIGSSGLLVTALVVALIAGLGLYAAWRSAPKGADRSDAGHRIPIRNPKPDEPLTIQRYLPAGQVLAAGAITVKRLTETQAQAREVLAAVLSPENKAPVLSELRLRSFFLDPAGTAYVDVTTGGQESVRASAWDEMLAVYAVVDTLTQNFEEIKQVRFLIDGRETQVLAGHLDLSRSFTKRLDLVRQ